MDPIGHKTIYAGQFWAGFVTLILIAIPAQAQFVPGGYYYPDAGAIGCISSAYSSAAQSEAYQQNRQLQTTSSMARSQAWLNLNQSMQRDAAARSAAVPDAGQAAREWMYQNAQPSRYSRTPITLPATQIAAASPQKAPPKKPASPQDVMLWPTLLKDKRFYEDRTNVEAPFRLAYSKGRPISVDDYLMIIKTVENMKADVKSMESQLVETEYNSVQKYLDDLIADAQKRIQAREATGERE